MKTTGKAPSSSATRNVGRRTLSSSRGRRSKKVSFRLPVEVYSLLKTSVPNVSGFLRRLVFDGLEKLPVVFEIEEFKLEVEVARLTEELEKVHRWQKLLLKHGSYAEAYLQKLKGGIVVDRSPFHIRDPPPHVKPEELVTVSDIVKYREKLAKRLVGLLSRLMELKLSSHMTQRKKEEVIEHDGEVY